MQFIIVVYYRYIPMYSILYRITGNSAFATDSLFSRKCKTGLENIFAPAALYYARQYDIYKYIIRLHKTNK